MARKSVERIKQTADERRQEQVDKILEVSVDLFYTKGYGNTTIRDIIHKAGILNGSLYNRFKSKEEILLAIVKKIVDEALAERAKLIRDDDVMTAVAFPAALEIYMASHDRRAADLIYNAHISWQAVEVFLEINEKWAKKMNQSFRVAGNNAVTAGIISVVGGVGNISGAYAHGYNIDFRVTLSTIMAQISSVLRIPLFNMDDAIDRIIKILESDKITVFGTPLNTAYNPDAPSEQ